MQAQVNFLAFYLVSLVNCYIPISLTHVNLFSVLLGDGQSGAVTRGTQKRHRKKKTAYYTQRSQTDRVTAVQEWVSYRREHQEAGSTKQIGSKESKRPQVNSFTRDQGAVHRKRHEGISLMCLHVIGTVRGGKEGELVAGTSLITFGASGRQQVAHSMFVRMLRQQEKISFKIYNAKFVQHYKNYMILGEALSPKC